MTLRSPEMLNSGMSSSHSELVAGDTPKCEGGDADMGLVGTPSFADSTVGLVRKLQELKDAKETAMAEVAAKFDMDIEAVKRVLSLA